MKYFEVTYVERGRRKTTVVQSKAKMQAVAEVKKKIDHATVIKAVMVPAPVEDSFENMTIALKKRFAPKIDKVELNASIKQIAVMTDAGIPINDTLKDVGDNVKNPRLKEIYSSINQAINSGSTIYDAMQPYEAELGNIVLAMTELGERTGNISESYDKLADILEEIHENKKKFKKAIRTPMITLAAMGVAFVIMIVFVVPKFKEIFEKLNTELPVPTKILLALEWALNNYGLYILAGLFLAVTTIKYLYKNNPDVKYAMDKSFVNPKFYMIYDAVYLSTMHVFNLVFGELVKAGIPVSEALSTALGIVENDYLRSKLIAVGQDIEKGMSLTAALKEADLYENMLLQMIRAGEAGGQLDAMLDKVTNYYGRKFQDFIDNISSYIEPIMMFFIAGLVLLMALGIFMPMWDMGNAAKN